MSNYTAGTSVVDVDALFAGATEAEAEIGFLKPDNADQWSAYWYNGFIYVNDINRGFDVIELSDFEEEETEELEISNPQTQEFLILDDDEFPVAQVDDD